MFFYYALRNFYQNHRRYVRSKSDSQLYGTHVSPNSLTSCQPYATFTNETKTYAILPCGMIANSLFNDTFKVFYENVEVILLKKGIAWQSDIDRKFNNLAPSGKFCY